jgi:6-pyruvoyltetrahydropterin/6-carboxytetrahydropterin synthase
METVTRTVSFEAAHMLSDYYGDCNNLHGHSYKLIVSIANRLLPPLPKEALYDMIIDFSDLDAIICNAVLQKVDHATILSAPAAQEKKETELRAYLFAHEMRYYELPEGRSTCETMVRHFRDLIDKELKDWNTYNLHNGLHVYECTLWETAKSYATITAEEMDYESK